MPATFDQHGIRFDYPDNWTVDQVEETAHGVEVMISSPETAFWHLSRHPADSDLEPLFDEAIAALRSEYQEIEVEPHDSVLEEHLIEGYAVQFFCLDLTSTCWIQGIESPTATYLLICQAEDREFEEVQLVFQAMLASALRSIPDAM